MEVKETVNKSTTKKFRIPNSYVVVAIFIALVAISTWFIRPGSYQYEQVDINGVMRNVAISGSFEYLPALESNPTTIFDYIQSFYKGAVAQAGIIFVILICSGSFTVLVKTGAFHAGIGSVLRRLKGKEVFIAPILMMLFALGASIFGMGAEFYGFIPLMVGLGVAMGYDAMFGFSIIILGMHIGFMGSTLNPYTVAVAQSIAGVPLYSGLGYRALFFFLFILVCVIYVIRYGKKIKRNPELSAVYGEDNIHAFDRSELHSYQVDKKVVLVMLDTLITLGILMYGMMKLGWGYSHLCALFLVMSWVAAIIYRWSADKWVDEFIDGARGVLWGAILTGMASGIVVILNEAKIMDTIIYLLSNVLSGVPSFMATQAMLFVQTLINLFIPSGSGQAAVTIPILAPIGDMLGVSRQVTTLAFQFGDGLSNLIWPTCVVVTVCGLGGISVRKWWEWFLPLAAIIYVMQMVFLGIAGYVGL